MPGFAYLAHNALFACIRQIILFAYVALTALFA